MPATPDLIHGYEELEEARPGYIAADEFYDGDCGEIFASEKVKLLLAKAGVNRMEDVNYAHIPVDVVVDRLEITSVSVVEDEPDDDQADDDEDKGPSPAQKALDRMWQRNQLDAESDGAHKKACKHGDAYLFVWPVTKEGDGGVPSKVIDVDVRINSAHTTRAVYDVEDPLKIAYVIKSWTFDTVVNGQTVQLTRANLYYDDRIERWISLPDRKGKALCDPKSWREYDDDGKPAVIAHSYGMPFFHLRNDRPYGRPEHRYAYGSQQLLNKLVAALASAVDYQSFPQRYLLMDPMADQVMQNMSDPLHPEDDLEDPEDEGNKASLDGDPSAVWRLWGAKNAGQFDPANPDTFLKPFDRFVQAMGETTQTPLYRFGSKFAATPSGEALRVADAPTTNKVNNRQMVFGSVWADALQFGLKLLGIIAEVQVRWLPAQQVTDAEGWRTVQAKIDAGVPRDVALMETGYEADEVGDWLSADTDPALMRRVQTLQAIATAAQALGAAIVTGAVSRELAAKIMAHVLGESAGDEELEKLAATVPVPEPPPMPPGPGALPAGPPPRPGQRPPAERRQPEPVPTG